MKRGIRTNSFTTIFLAIFIFLISLSSAATCSDDQTILKLHDTANTHGEFWNGAGNYPIEICYDTIFGSSYTGANPHTCTGTNNVTRLAFSTNAHAEGPNANTPGYTPVCYGDLSCTLTNEASCTGTSKIIVRLSSNSNAHLGDVTSTYTNVICCSTGGAPPPPPPVKTAFWADPSEQKLGNRFMINTEGGVVRLIASGLSPGETITFEIWDNDTAESTSDDAIKNIIVVANSSGTAVSGGISFSLIDYDKGDDIPADDDLLELYFIARNTTLGTEIHSENELLLNHTDTQRIIPVEKEGCAFFTEQTACNAAPESYWRKSELDYEANNRKVGGVGCQQTDSDSTFFNCSCQWTTRSQCEFNWQGIPSPANNPGNVPPDCIGSCNIQSDYGQCVDDILTISYLANFEIESTSCTDTIINTDQRDECNLMNGRSDEIMCGLSPSLVLPFFSTMQFFVSAISVLLIYAFLIWKKRF